MSLLFPFTSDGKEDKKKTVKKDESCHTLMKAHPYTVVLQAIPSITFRKPLDLLLPFAFEYRGTCKESDRIFLAYKVLSDEERKERINKYCKKLKSEENKDKPKLAVEFCKKHGG